MKHPITLTFLALLCFLTTARGTEKIEKEKLYIGVQGGVSSFMSTSVSNPFDRLSPNLNISVGLWATSNVGLRATYQGVDFNSYKYGTLNYGAIHLDVMANLTNIIKKETNRRWNIIPYIGLGVAYNAHKPGGFCTVCNDDPHTNHPFSIFYGVQGRYKVNENIHFTAEFGDLATFQSFDGYGSAATFGDHLITFSTGIAYTFNCKKKKGNKTHSKNVIPESNIICNRKLEKIILVRDSMEVLSDTICFERGTVFPSGKNEIEKIENIVKYINNIDGDIEICCSADMYITDATKRYSLARRRTKAVAAALIRCGVEEQRIYINIKAYERNPESDAVIIRFIQ